MSPWRSFDVEHTFAISCRFCQSTKEADSVSVCSSEDLLTANKSVGKGIVVDAPSSVTKFNNGVVVA